jgi:hypothetical protein
LKKADPVVHQKQLEINITAPQETYTSASYGRYNSTENPVTRIYGEDVFDSRILRVESKKAEQPVPGAIQLSAEEFEVVDLSNDPRIISS